MKRQREVTQPDMPDEKTLRVACADVLTRLCLMDPTYESYIDAAMAENAWTTDQCVLSWCAYVLDHGLHMNIAVHPALAPGMPVVPAIQECLGCGKEFKPSFPGERFCVGSRCADAYRARTSAEAPPAAAE